MKRKTESGIITVMQSVEADKTDQDVWRLALSNLEAKVAESRRDALFDSALAAVKAAQRAEDESCCAMAAKEWEAALAATRLAAAANCSALDDVVPHVKRQCSSATAAAAAQEQQPAVATDLMVALISALRDGNATRRSGTTFLAEIARAVIRIDTKQDQVIDALKLTASALHEGVEHLDRTADGAEHIERVADGVDALGKLTNALEKIRDRLP
jgi:hypothetical protein